MAFAIVRETEAHVERPQFSKSEVVAFAPVPPAASRGITVASRGPPGGGVVSRTSAAQILQASFNCPYHRGRTRPIGVPN